MFPIPVQQAEWFFGLIGFVLVIVIFWLVITVLLCVWVYRDAESRGMNGALWLIIVFIAGILGLIVYLIVREEKHAAPVTRVCLKCGRLVPAEAKFCPYCGKEFPE